MVYNDKIGQIPAKFGNLIDNIFKVFCGINFYKGKKFLLATYDLTQRLGKVLPRSSAGHNLVWSREMGAYGNSDAVVIWRACYFPVSGHR